MESDPPGHGNDLVQGTFWVQKLESRARSSYSVGSSDSQKS